MIAVTLIDNYDSFTWNLVHYLGALGADVRVVRNDAMTSAEVLASQPNALVLSPGPCSPKEAGICLELIDAAKGTTPILGVCLGHQAIGEAFGGHVVRAPSPVHGKLATIEHDGRGLFRGMNSAFKATRYHSLVVEAATLPASLDATATTDGLLMGLQHRTLPIHGVQFHPESIMSEHGHQLLGNFLELAQNWNATRATATVRAH